jgi:hypothetical protein
VKRKTELFALDGRFSCDVEDLATMSRALFCVSSSNMPLQEVIVSHGVIKRYKRCSLLQIVGYADLLGHLPQAFEH